MSKLEARDAGKKNGDTPEPQTSSQRHGAALMLAIFALVIVLMVVLQKRAVQ